MKQKIVLIFILLVGLYSCKEKNTPTNKEQKNEYFELAEKQFDENKIDSAYINYSKAKEQFRELKDSAKEGIATSRQGMIAAMKGDYYGSQEILLEALSKFDTTNKEHFPSLASTNNTLGIVNYSLKNYQEAIKFYKETFKYQTDSNNIITTLNNLATTYRNAGDFDQSIKLFEEIIKKPTHPLNYARILSNYSFTKWSADSTYNPLPSLLKALNIRIQEKDYLGQNSSYSHLAQFYEDSDKSKALYYSKEMYKIASFINHPDSKIEALSYLINLSPAEYSKNYFNEYLKLNDSLNSARQIDKNQFALIRYQTEKLKNDKLLLERNLDVQKDQIIRQRFISGLVVFGLITTIFFSILWYKKRKQKLELELQSSIRENQLKTSKKVHDVVANGIYRVMNEIENQSEIDREGILDKLEDMYEKSRDISYETTDEEYENFHLKISDLVDSFSNENRIILLVGNSENLWKKVNVNTKYEVENIIQELLVNMKKHSEANKITLKFENLNNSININYIDNGKGFDDKVIYKNGLNSTVNRIKNLKGDITFDSQMNKGLNIKINFPIY